MSIVPSGQEIPPARERPGLLIHGAGPAVSDAFAGVLRSAANASTALPPGTGLEVVVQGAGVKFLEAGSDLAVAIGGVLDCGVRILACENSMRSAGIAVHQLLPGIGRVPAAVGHLARRQWEGWAYVRL